MREKKNQGKERGTQEKVRGAGVAGRKEKETRQEEAHHMKSGREREGGSGARGEQEQWEKADGGGVIMERRQGGRGKEKNGKREGTRMSGEKAGNGGVRGR